MVILILLELNSKQPLGQGEKEGFLLIPDRRYNPRAVWQIRRDSGVDSKVWMEKGTLLGN